MEHSSSSSCPFGYGGTTRQDVFLLLFNRIFREPKHMENNHTTHSDSEETRYRRTCTPFIKMLRRNTPYGNIIYMKIQLKVTRKWPEDHLSYRFILMKQICEKGTIFQWKIHERGTSCQKWYTWGKGLDLGAETAKLYWAVSPPPVPRAFHKLLGSFFGNF